MKKAFHVFIVLALLWPAFAPAQYRVTLRIVQAPPGKGEPLYVAGSFNEWKPAETSYRFSSGPVPALTLQLPRGKHEFKITRGSWSTAETTAGGGSANNRVLMISSDTSMDISVAQWADHFPQPPRRSTATKQVQVIDTAFLMPQLNRHRRIWICLPAGYLTSGKKYPVLYMQDGQNLFDEATAPYGEWGVDEAMDTLGPKYGEAIIVGIDHGGSKRNNEYSPYDMKKYGKGEGDRYLDFLVHTLKPFIDRHYRTRKDEAHTFVAGSSMGGLISFYAMLKYPRVFGGAGVFSPAFWITPQLRAIRPEQAQKVKGRIYFYGGQQESESMVPDMLAVFDQMRHHSKAKMETVIRAGGKHNETTWRQEFPLFYAWLMKKKD